jgi:hypothetical protein
MEAEPTGEFGSGILFIPHTGQFITLRVTPGIGVLGKLTTLSANQVIFGL